MDYLMLIADSAITGAVYAIIEVIKKIVGENEIFKKFITLISLGLGIVAGVI